MIQHPGYVVYFRESLLRCGLRLSDGKIVRLNDQTPEPLVRQIGEERYVGTWCSPLVNACLAGRISREMAESLLETQFNGYYFCGINLRAVEALVAGDEEALRAFRDPAYRGEWGEGVSVMSDGIVHIEIAGPEDVRVMREAIYARSENGVS